MPILRDLSIRVNAAVIRLKNTQPSFTNILRTDRLIAQGDRRKLGRPYPWDFDEALLRGNRILWHNRKYFALEANAASKTKGNRRRRARISFAKQTCFTETDRTPIKTGIWSKELLSQCFVAFR